MQKYHYLYKTINVKNDMFYVGIHSTNDLDDGYLGSGKYLKAAIKKYGVENFEKKILEFFDTREKLLEQERNLVNKEFILNPLCMNLHIGGSCAPMSNLGSKRSEETKLKMSKWKRTKEYCDKIRLANTGKKASADSKEKMRNKKLGTTCSLETRLKMSIAHKDKSLTEVHRQNMRKPKNEEHKKNISKGRKLMFLKNFENIKNKNLNIAKNYKGTSFSTDHESEYTHAIKNNYLDELKSYLKIKLVSHSKERTLKIFETYKGTNFGKEHRQEYLHAIRNNYSHELKK